MVKSLEILALGKLIIKCKQSQYEDEELKKSDLSEYCLVGTFLHSCHRNNFFLCECQKWGHSSKKTFLWFLSVRERHDNVFLWFF